MKIFEKLRERKEREKAVRRDIEFNEKINSEIERKKLSHNEREAIAILRREKENYLKDALRYEEERRRAEEQFRERGMWRNGGFNLLE